MRTRSFVCAMGALALAVGIGGLQGETDQEATAERVAGLIKQLGDNKFSKREAASKALAEVGEPALAALRKAVASSDDPEVRHRAGDLVGSIENALPYLFNGKDLTGWSGLAGCWTVKDGALVGTTEPEGLTHSTFLCSNKMYKDFELKFQVRVTGVGWPGNSGVQIRSQIVDATQFTVKGPQCDIGAGYWGDLFGELDSGLIKQAPQADVARVVNEGEFNDYFIRCAGKHVTIKLRGVTTIDDDFAELPEIGHIALQLNNGGPMTVTFRNIEFKDLSRK